LRHALCRRATPTTPVSDPVVIGRFRLRNPAAFPVQMAGRRSHRPFRGLLGLHSHCGPSTRRPTLGGPMFRELQRFGCPPRRLGSYRDVPTISRTGLSPARDTAPLHGAHSNPCCSSASVELRPPRVLRRPELRRQLGNPSCRKNPPRSMATSMPLRTDAETVETTAAARALALPRVGCRLELRRALVGQQFGSTLSSLFVRG
jgi:hypothetical protein